MGDNGDGEARRFRRAEQALYGGRWTPDQAMTLVDLVLIGLDLSTRPDVAVEAIYTRKHELDAWKLIGFSEQARHDQNPIK